MSDTVEILLATYNAEPFLAEQLDSIFRQTHGDWTLLVRDDGSTDGTAEILADRAKGSAGRITLVTDGSGNLGASGNFSQLMQHADGYYLMFCDQDDVWLPQKVAATLAKMKEMERRYGKETPLLAHTDLRVVDEKLDTVSDSLWNYQLSDPAAGAALNRLLLQNVATGCSVMINRPLCDLALPIPAEAMMHDWWIALTAAALGKIGHLPEPTVLYRQHGGNDTGAKRWSSLKLLSSLLSAGERKKQNAVNLAVAGRIQRQAEAFLARYRPRLRENQREVLEAYIKLSTRCYFAKRYNTIKYGFYYTGTIRNIARLLTI